MQGGAKQAMSRYIVEERRLASAPAPLEPKGRMGVARRSLRCSSSTMCTDIASSSRLELASQAPCARPLLILGQAPGSLECTGSFFTSNACYPMSVDFSAR